MSGEGHYAHDLSASDAEQAKRARDALNAAFWEYMDADMALREAVSKKLSEPQRDRIIAAVDGVGEALSTIRAEVASLPWAAVERANRAR